MPTKTKELNEENTKKTGVSKSAGKKPSAIKKVIAKVDSKTNKEKVATTKGTSVKKSNTRTSEKKASTSAVSKTSKVKKDSTSKSVDKNAVIKKSTTAKKSAAKATTSKADKTEKPLAEVVEYYDLPYRYNETVVKILYQTPDTLFVYWDIADSDRENYIKQYGENFFKITRPVLIIHNDTMNYSFEIPINDFANSWYLHINDSKCDYRVELGRRPNYYNAEVTNEIKEKIHTDYIYVSTSNGIESPNDHVLFNTNENNTIRMRNVKNNNEKSVSLYDIVKRLPAMKRVQNIPYISEELLKSLYSGIYENEDISLFEKLTNPSSAGNPSSGSMSSRSI